MYKIQWSYYDKNKYVQYAEKVYTDYNAWCDKMDKLDLQIEKGKCIGYLATKVETFTRGVIL